MADEQNLGETQLTEGQGSFDNSYYLSGKSKGGASIEGIWGQVKKRNDGQYVDFDGVKLLFRRSGTIDVFDPDNTLTKESMAKIKSILPELEKWKPRSW